MNLATKMRVQQQDEFRKMISRLEMINNKNGGEQKWLHLKMYANKTT